MQPMIASANPIELTKLRKARENQGDCIKMFFDTEGTEHTESTEKSHSKRKIGTYSSIRL